MATRFLSLIGCALAAAVGGCGGGGSQDAPEKTPAPKPAPPAAATVRTASSIEGSFPVRGHSLYLSCRGRSAPTVVYLHAFGGSSANAGLVPDLLDAATACASTTEPTSAAAARCPAR